MVLTKQGRGMFGVEMRIVNDDQEILPWDGKAFGALQVRGPWVCSDYYKLEGNAGSHTDDGWFNTAPSDKPILVNAFANFLTRLKQS